MPLWGKLLSTAEFLWGRPSRRHNHTYLFGAPCHHEGHVPISVALLALRGLQWYQGLSGFWTDYFLAS